MFHDQIRRPITKQIFFLLFLLAVVIGMTRSVSADSGPLFNDGIVTGRIVDSAGNGVSGLSLSLVGLGEPEPFDKFAPSGKFTDTDADGYYRFEDVRRDSYKIRIRDYEGKYAAGWIGGNLQISTGTTIQVWNSVPVELNGTTELAGYITGEVRAGVPTDYFNPSVSVLYFNEAESYWQTIDTEYVDSDDNGRYSLGGLPAGSYHIVAYDYFNGDGHTEYFENSARLEDATPVRVEFGQRTAGIDMTLGDDANSSTSIQGRVVSAETGQPLSNINVNLYRLYEDLGDWSGYGSRETTDANGNYEFTNLADANYKVGFSDWNEVYASEFNGNKPTLGGAPELAVSKDNLIKVDAELAAGAIVNLGVVSSNGADFSASSLEAYRWNDHDAWLEVDDSFRDRDNAFRLTGLQAGKYVFKVTGSYGSGNYFSLFYGNTSEAANAQQVTIETGAVYNLEPIELQTNTGTISGRVTNQSGQPASNIDVWIFSARTNGAAGQIVGLTSTDREGYYAHQQVDAGSYRIQASDYSSDLLPTFNGNVLHEGEAPVLVLNANETIAADIEMRTGGSIQGRVTIASNFKYDYAYAEAWRVVDGEWRAENAAAINSDGSYNVGKLPAGAYKIYLYTGKWAGSYPARPFIFGEWVDDAVTRIEASAFPVEEGMSVAVPDQHLGNIIASQSRTDGAISGQVLSAAWKSGEGFEARAYIKFYPPRGRAYFVLEQTVAVDEAGNYTLDGLLHGTYVVGFYDTTNEHKPEYYNNVADISSATQLEISAETPSISSIDAILQLSAARVR